MANSFSDYLSGSSLFDFDTTSGQIIPDTTEVLSAVKELMKDVFDKNLDVSDETPAGRLAEMFALAIKKFASVTAAYANQINPYYATGQMLDAIGSLFAVTRTGATATTVYVTLAGTPNTVIPDGSLISDSANHQFRIQGEQTIPSGGTTSCVAVCTTTGEISVDDGTVTNIISSTVGWSSVTNTGTKSTGETIESDEHLRERILLSRWTGTAFAEAIRAAIERCDNVDSVVVLENGEASDMYYGESKQFTSEAPASGKYVKVGGHSMLAIAYGKTMTTDDYPAIAAAIYDSKSAGCGYTGLDATSQGTTKGSKITQNVTDSSSGAIYPITFNKPDEIDFGVNISVVKGSYSGTDTELAADVKKAIIAWANGEAPFVDGLKLGQSLFAFEIGAAVSDIIPSIQISSCQIVTDWSSTQVSSYSVSLFVYEIGVLDPDHITVNVSA